MKVWMSYDQADYIKLLQSPVRLDLAELFRNILKLN